MADIYSAKIVPEPLAVCLRIGEGWIAFDTTGPLKLFICEEDAVLYCSLNENRQLVYLPVE